MRYAGLVLAFACISGAFGAGSDEQGVTRAEKEWSEAARRYDLKAFEQLLASDYVGVSITGKVIDKATLLHDVANAPKLVKEKNAKVLEEPSQDLKIRIHGPVAIVTGARKSQGPSGLHTRFTRVWLKTGDHWQLTAFQATRVVENEGKKEK